MKKYDKISIIILGAILLLLSIRTYVITNKVREFGKYSIATIIKIQVAVEGGPIADYIFCVKNKKYGSFIDLKNRETSVKVGDRFILKYEEGNPDNSAIFLNSLIVNLADSVKKYKIDSCSLK